MDGRHGASFSSSSRGRRPPLSPTPLRAPFPSPKPTAAAAASQSPMEGSECAGAATASLPGVCPRPGGPAGRAGADQHATRSPGDSARECKAGGRDSGRAAASGGRASGEGAPGEGGEGQAAGCGDGVVPAADGVRTREVGREMSPHRASLARSRRRRRQHRRRHLHFCPSFSVSQAPLPSGGGGANGRRRRREETGGRGHGCEGAGLRETGAKALPIGRLNVVGPRRCKARADWSVRPRAQPPGGRERSRMSVPESTC